MLPGNTVTIPKAKTARTATSIAMVMRSIPPSGRDRPTVAPRTYSADTNVVRGSEEETLAFYGPIVFFASRFCRVDFGNLRDRDIPPRFIARDAGFLIDVQNEDCRARLLARFLHCRFEFGFARDFDHVRAVTGGIGGEINRNELTVKLVGIGIAKAILCSETL